MKSLGQFEFWFPIEKGQAVEEKGKRVVYGVASDESLDMDGECVTAGAIKKSLDYFLKHGRIDYDHKSKDNPKFIVGEPMAVRFDGNNSFHIKSNIYKGLEIADEVWKQLKAGNNRLGWSIGGRVIAKSVQFDKASNRRIPKITNALINHIAITPHPKNLNTFATVQPYGEWLKSLGDPKNNCCGLCALTGDGVCHKAISTAGNTALGTNPVIPQDLEKDVKKLKMYLTSSEFSFDPDKSVRYLFKQGVEKGRIKEFVKYIVKNKTRIEKINQKLTKTKKGGN